MSATSRRRADLGAAPEFRTGATWRWLSTLIGTLVAGAYLAVVSRTTHEFWWVGGIGLLPLLWSIRRLRPLAALACGAIWGGCVFAFAVALGPVAVPTPGTLLLLTATLACYACVGALTSRLIGFDPLVLALGWAGVETVLTPLHISGGLLSIGQEGRGSLDFVSRHLGYACVGALMVGVVASLLAIACRLRWRIPHAAPSPGLLAASGSVLMPRAALPNGGRIPEEGSPRAPPHPV